MIPSAGKRYGHSFYLRLSIQPYKKGDILTNPNGVDLLILKTYKSKWWKFLRWLGFEIKSPNVVKVKYK